MSEFLFYQKGVTFRVMKGYFQSKQGLETIKERGHCSDKEGLKKFSLDNSKSLPFTN